MVAELPQHLVWLFALVHVAGFLTAPLARFAEHRPGTQWMQWLMAAAMLVVGTATLALLLLGFAVWVLSGATLGFMLVTAVWDSGIQTS